MATSNVTTPTKRCRKCGGEFPATSEFFRVSRCGTVSSPCKQCVAQVKREWRQSHPELVAAQKQRSYVRNKATNNERSRRWYVNNREAERVRKQEIYRSDPELIKQRVKQWCLNNPERVQENGRKTYARLKADPQRLREARLRSLAYDKANPQRRYSTTRRYRARKRGALGSHTAEDIHYLYNEQNGLCAYCGIRLYDDYHVDHVQPLSRGGSNWPDNLAIACHSCNESKGSKMLDEWERMRGW